MHEVVNHAEQYVEGRVHTNGLENFWSLFKRGIAGTYVAVEPFHLYRYVDEQVFRFNNRKDKTMLTLRLAMSQVAGKRLTYSRTHRQRSNRRATKRQGRGKRQSPSSPCRTFGLARSSCLCCCFAFIFGLGAPENRSRNRSKFANASGPSMYSVCFINQFTLFTEPAFFLPWSLLIQYIERSCSGPP